MSITIYDCVNETTLACVQDKNKDALESYEMEKINGNTWVHAQIKDPYFEEVVSESYFAPYRKGGMIAVVYSKGPYSQTFHKILESLSGF